jgi:hypothetical protein
MTDDAIKAREPLAPCWETGPTIDHLVTGGICTPESVTIDEVSDAIADFCESRGWGINAVFKPEHEAQGGESL